MDDNIKNVLDDLKRENDNLKQKLVQIESSLNKPEVAPTQIFPDKIQEADPVVNLNDSINLEPVVMPPADNSVIAPTNSKNTAALDNGSISFIVLGLIFLFIWKFLGIIFIIIGLIKWGGGKSKSSSTESTITKDQSFELNVGIKWFQTIGILALVVGVGFFVKYAIDLGWINHVARIILGFMLGFGLIIFGHFMRSKKDFQSWSETIMGGGIAICYFIGYMMYYAPAYREILGITKGLDLFLLIAISIMSIGISLYEKSQGLAAWSFGLSYFTFFLFDRDSYSNIVYLIITSLSAMILGFSKKWHFINFLGLVGSYICFAMNNNNLHVMNISNQANQIILIFIFAIHNISSLVWAGNTKDKELAIYNSSNIIINPVLFFLIGYFGGVFNQFHWVVLSLAIFYWLMTLLMYAWKKTIQPIHIFLSTLFLTLFIILKFDYRLVSTFWSLLFVFLGLMYLTTNLKPIKTMLPGFAILLFGKIIFFDTWWFMFKDLHSFDLITFIKYFVYFVSFAVVGYVIDQDKDREEYDFPGAYYWASFIIGGLAIYNLTNANYASVSWLIYAFLFLIMGISYKKIWFRLQGLVLILLAILRIVLIDISGLEPIYKTLVFITLGGVLLIASYFYIKYQDKLKELF